MLWMLSLLLQLPGVFSTGNCNCNNEGQSNDRVWFEKFDFNFKLCWKPGSSESGYEVQLKSIDSYCKDCLMNLRECGHPGMTCCNISEHVMVTDDYYGIIHAKNSSNASLISPYLDPSKVPLSVPKFEVTPSEHSLIMTIHPLPPHLYSKTNNRSYVQAVKYSATINDRNDNGSEVVRHFDTEEYVICKLLPGKEYCVRLWRTVKMRSIDVVTPFRSPRSEPQCYIPLRQASSFELIKWTVLVILLALLILVLMLLVRMAYGYVYDPTFKIPRVLFDMLPDLPDAKIAVIDKLVSLEYGDASRWTNGILRAKLGNPPSSGIYGDKEGVSVVESQTLVLSSLGYHAHCDPSSTMDNNEDQDFLARDDSGYGSYSVQTLTDKVWEPDVGLNSDQTSEPDLHQPPHPNFDSIRDSSSVLSNLLSEPCLGSLIIPSVDLLVSNADPVVVSKLEPTPEILSGPGVDFHTDSSAYPQHILHRLDDPATSPALNRILLSTVILQGLDAERSSSNEVCTWDDKRDACQPGIDAGWLLL
uniref:Interferon/interleukin receptor domain-containing protein n=1 Tax=Eptatretus burgeri TaxID=7764 RepID=A0A8C4QF71_EPTBU